MGAKKKKKKKKNQRTVHEWVKISLDLVNEWVRFFKDQEYE